MTTGRHIAEQERTRANMLQVGKIVEADYAKARVRVQMNDLKSAWLPWSTMRAGGNRSWSAPEVGEQVMVACPDGDPASGVVMGAIYQQSAGAPADSADVQRTVYGDGTTVTYDRAASHMDITLAGGGTVNLIADGGVTITGDTTITGTLTVSEIITAQNGLTAGGGSGSTVQVNGRIESTDDQVAGGISQMHHTHEGVETGGSTSGEPVG